MSGPDQADNIDRRVGKRIAALRAKRGLSQADLAFALGVAETEIVRMEGGEARASAETLHHICRLLDCHVADLMH